MSQRRETTRRFDPFIPGVACLVLAVMGLLHGFYPRVYHDILDIWMLQPFDDPFQDLSFVTASVSCFGQGIDVYATNPCDIIDRQFNYSPLWLRLSFLPHGPIWTNILGLIVMTGFLVSLGCMTWPRQWRGRLLAVLGVLSYSTAYAVERGNMDLVMFIFAAFAALVLGGRPLVRGIAYAAIVFTTMLKFYPAVALIILLRERWRTVLAAGAVIAVALGLFAVAFRDEFGRMAATLPVTWPPGLAWGAKGLPRGLNDVLPDLLTVLGYDAPWAVAARDSHLPAFVLLIVLLLGALGTAMRLSRAPRFTAALDTLSPASDRLLLIGAALVCGCFFLGQSLPYRAIHLLFVLPVFLSLGEAAPPAGRTPFRWTVVVMLLILWELPIRWRVPWIVGARFVPTEGPVFAFVPGSLLTYIAWAALELCWWWVITVLLAVLLRVLASVGGGVRAEA